MGASSWTVAAVLAAILVGLVVLASALGVFGPVVACGAEGTARCIEWPALLSPIVWLGFMLVLVAAAVWQIREWRRPGPPTPRHDRAIR